MNELEDFEYNGVNEELKTGVCVSKHSEFLTVEVGSEDEQMQTYDGAVCNIPHNKSIELRNWFNEAYPQWISVEDRLPPCDGEYLVFNGNKVRKDMRINFFRTKANEFVYYHEGITHWQPLHKPPR